MHKKASKKLVLFFQNIDLQFITFPKRTRERNFIKYFTLILIISLVSASVFVINRNVSSIITEAQNDVGADLAPVNLRIIISSAISISYSLFNGIIFVALISLGFQRNYREQKNSRYYFLWYLIYIFFAIIVFSLNFGILPSLSDLDATLNAVATDTFDPIGEVAYTLNYLKYIIFAFLFLETIYEVWHFWQNRFVNPKDKKYSLSKIVAFAFLSFYAFVFMFVIPNTFNEAKALALQWVDFFKNADGTFQFNQNFIGRLIFVVFIVISMLFPIFYHLAQVNSQKKILRLNSIYFSYTVSNFIVSIISALVTLLPLLEANVTRDNYAFLGASLAITVIFFLYIYFNKTVLKTSLYLYLAVTFALFFDFILFVGFDLGETGLLNTSSSINLVFFAIAVFPILVFLVTVERTLPYDKRWTKVYFFFLNLFLGSVALSLFAVTYVSDLDLTLQRLLNILVSNVGIWFIIYLITAFFIILAFLVIFIKLLRTIAIVNKKDIQKQQKIIQETWRSKINKKVFRTNRNLRKEAKKALA